MFSHERILNELPCDTIFIKRVTRFGIYERKRVRYQNYSLFASFRVKYLGVGGLTVHGAQRLLSEIQDLHPEVIMLDLGANDLDSRTTQDPELLAANIVDFANELLRIAAAVYVLPAYHRSRPRRTDYAHVLPRFNATLRRICRELSQVTFWPHRNLSLDWEKFLLPDGVHFNVIGLLRYFRSVRGAVLHARRQLHPT